MNHLSQTTNLKIYQPIFFELGLITVLTVFIVIFRTGINSDDSDNLNYIYIVGEEKKGEERYASQESTFIELEAEPVVQQDPVIPPLPPNVPVDPPEEELIDDIAHDFDIDMDMELSAEKLTVPLPDVKKEMDYYLAAQEMPDLENGWSEFHKEVVYPEHARRSGIEGRVYLQFIVNKEGEVEEPVVLRGIGGGCDEAALRAVKEAKFIPGQIQGEPVRVKIGMAVRFELNRLTGLPQMMIRGS